MKLTELRIGPKTSWDMKSPMVCTVKLSSDHATVETILSDDQIQAVLRLVQGIVADAAARNVADFVAQVGAISASAVPAIEVAE